MKLKRLLSLILVLALALSILPTTAITANAAGKMTVEQLKSKFPAGKYWNGGNADSYTSSPCKHHSSGCTYTGSCGCNSFKGLSIQCMGYAEKLGYDFTGYNPRNNANGWTTYTSSSALDSLKPGDIVRYSVSSSVNHSIFVTGVSGNTVTFTDCNSDGHCIIRWGKTISKSTLKSNFFHVRSAPYEISSTPTLTMRFHANGGTIPTVYEYKIATEGDTLRLRKAPSLSADTLAQIPDGTTITATETKTADGYTWAKTTYGGQTGWCAVSDGLASRVGYYLQSSLVYEYSSGNAYALKWSYGSGGKNGLVNNTTLKLTRNGYTFVGWSVSTDGSTTVFDQDDTTLKAEDICADVKTASQTVTLYAVWRENTPESLTIGSLPTKLTYSIGEDLDLTGLTIIATHADGTTTTVTEGFTVSGFDSDTAGIKKVTVAYESFSTILDITVVCTHSGGEATCMESAVCAVCGDSYGELNANNHKGETYLLGQKDATYEEEGYTGDTYCADCDSMTQKGVMIPALVRPAEAEIVSHPVAAEITAGYAAQFSVEATNVASYKWQYRRNKSAPWVNTTLTGYATDTLSVPALLSRNGYQYRCRIIGTDGKVLLSEPATLTVNDSIIINTQPTRQIVDVDANATFAVEAEGVGLTYQWLYRKNADDFWKVTGLTGNKTNTLTVPALVSRNGYQYRCAITDENGIKIHSSVATLSAIGFTKHPADQTVAVNANAVFTVAAEGQNLTYQWQYRKSEDGSWMTTSLTGAKTDTLTVKATSTRNGYQYRCRITDAQGVVQYSDWATLYIE